MFTEIEEINDRIDELHQKIRAVGVDSSLVDELEELQVKLREHGKNLNSSKDASDGGNIGSDS
jgi:uncharacterized coiled-coil DUF342 family protein